MKPEQVRTHRAALAADLAAKLPRVRRAPGQAVSCFDIGQVRFGGRKLVLIGGPCAVETRASLWAAARAVLAAGGAMLRGGAFKPRTSPYDFQGLGEAGLDLLGEVKAEFGLPFVTEVLDPRDVAMVAARADMLQIGSRSIQNFPLLREAGMCGLPLLLKRGMMTTVPEWLNAAEHAMAAGATRIVLCERGIRTFEGSLRNTLDLGSVALVKAQTHLPVIVDPSHAAGDSTYVTALSRAAVAVGADGLLVEVHEQPSQALSDSEQSLSPAQFAELSSSCRAIARVLGRDL